MKLVKTTEFCTCTECSIKSDNDLGVQIYSLHIESNPSTIILNLCTQCLGSLFSVIDKTLTNLIMEKIEKA